MRTKRSFAAFLCAISLLMMGSFSKITVIGAHAAGEKTLVAGGDLFGVSIKTAGVLVTALSPFESEKQRVSPAESAGLMPGDFILRVNGVEVSGTQMLAQSVAAAGGEQMELLIRRGDEKKSLSLVPLRSDEDGVFRAGVYVKDRMAGVGTLTYYDPESGAFAGLGHGICDTQTEILLPVQSGEISRVSLDAVVRGQSGAPGELQASFEKGVIGKVIANHETGVYGVLQEPLNASEQNRFPVAEKEAVYAGPAELYANVSDQGVKRYEIAISEINDSQAETKNFLVTVTDPELLKLTGGIVQGMSGSPIIQDGKIVGALTHVLVNHPERGYGIYVENMLKETSGALAEIGESVAS